MLVSVRSLIPQAVRSVGSSSNLIRTSDDMPTLAFMSYSAAANQAGTLLDWLSRTRPVSGCSTSSARTT